MRNYYKCPTCGQNAAFSHHYCIKEDMTKTIKGELLGLDGEWEIQGWKTGFVNFHSKDLANIDEITLKRVPEVSELEKWINYTYPNPIRSEFVEGQRNGAKRLVTQVIKVIEEHGKMCREYPYTSCTLEDLVAYLKKWAGVK